MRVLFWVQSNLGSGHVIRAGRITAAMIRQGMEVVIVGGGRHMRRLEAFGASIEPLPTIVAAVDDIRRLEDGQGRPVSEQLWRSRRRLMAKVVEDVDPHVILTETFPFGRTAFRAELLPVLQSVHEKRRRPRVVASVRDILVTKRNPARNDEMLDIVEKYYDRVLVHGDPALIGFDATFPGTAELGARVSHTGYVVDPVDPSPADQRQGIVVSAGGGAVGRRLVEAALIVAGRADCRSETWHVIVGPGGTTADTGRRQTNTKMHIILYDRVENLGQLVAKSKISVSQAGYNTVMEAVSARTPMVLVPYEANGEDEQLRRARCLADRGHAIVLREHDLTPSALGEAIDQAAALPMKTMGLKLNGAETTASMIRHLVDVDDQFSG